METKARYKHMSIKAEEDAEGSFSGTLSTYGNLDEVFDIMEKGAFDNTVKQKGTKFPLLYQHDQYSPIGSFEIIGIKDSLDISGRFNLETQKGREGYALLKAEDITGLSIGYYPVNYYYDEDGNRHLTEVELFEGSLVTFPANKLATAEAKNMDIKEKRKRIMKMTFIKGLTEEERNDALEELLELIGDEEPPMEDEELANAGKEDDDDEEDLVAAMEELRKALSAIKEIVDGIEEEKEDDPGDGDGENEEEE